MPKNSEQNNKNVDQYAQFIKKSFVLNKSVKE